MLTRAYTLRFHTPAFLGNAVQDGQWRTPPIKALLRQWWRVAYAADQTGVVDFKAMRTAEGRLFGVAADKDGDSLKSLVRIRLSRWDRGSLTPWAGQDSERVEHPEVKKDGKPSRVGAQLYLGYGPLILPRGQSAATLKAKAVIQAGEDGVLSVAFPAGAEGVRLDTALWLMNRYGTLGGRSRNGWGSFNLTPSEAGTPAFGEVLDPCLTAPWRSALNHDWPHALGTGDDKPLIWQTESLPDWKAVMRRLAELKIGLRTHFVFPQNVQPPHRQPLERHWLAYPITHHSTSAWDRNARLPNSLRFKVRADADGRLRGIIFHVPCLPPPQFKPNRAVIESVWSQVHAHLDHADRKLTRIPA